MIVIAHRGASGYAPENTLEAFKKALEMGSTAFEFDVHRSADGELVVHHDYDFKKTGGVDKKIRELSLAEIKKINVGKHFGSAPARVPSLAEVLSLLKEKADFINLEIKNDGNVYPGIEEDVLKSLRGGEAFPQKFLLSSFYFPSVKRLRELSSEARLGFLGHNLSTVLLLPALRKAKNLGCENFHLSSRIACYLNLKVLIKSGFKVCVYTVNEKKLALKLRGWGVYGVFSNYPDVLEREG